MLVCCWVSGMTCVVPCGAYNLVLSAVCGWWQVVGVLCENCIVDASIMPARVCGCGVFFLFCVLVFFVWFIVCVVV